MFRRLIEFFSRPPEYQTFKHKGTTFKVLNGIVRITESENCIAYYNEKEELHRDDGPAVIYTHGGEIWYQNGVIHRENGPAWIGDSLREWRKNGKLHRIGKPARIHVREDGTVHKEWWQEGVESAFVEGKNDAPIHEN